MAATDNRRPIASREAGWARAIAQRLSAASITPNQISVTSIVAAAVAGAAFSLTDSAQPLPRAGLLAIAALFCQFRLLCNLFDGLVAIEGGKQAPDGPFWNEFPDRIADILILAGAGYGAGVPSLGWAAAAMAVLTAYTRELGRACGLPADFSGPMAKQHRMATVTAAALVSMLEPLWSGRGGVLVAALGVIVAGSAITIIRRASNAVLALRAR